AGTCSAGSTVCRLSTHPIRLGRRRRGAHVNEFTLVRPTNSHHRRHAPVAVTWSRSTDWDLTDWRGSAAVPGTDPQLFFPLGTTGAAIEQIEAAKAVCRRCEAMDSCLAFALATNQECGVWGGTSEQERKIMRRAIVRTSGGRSGLAGRP